MVSMDEAIRRAYNRIQRVESRITGTICELADLQSVMGKFLYRYISVIIPLHEELLKKAREIEDIKALSGKKDSRHRREILTPLTAITREGDLSVQEQYDRRWGGKEYAKLQETQPGIQPANEKIKTLYGKIVMESHPGLATSEQDSSRRRKFFHDGTKAFVNRDEVTLQALVNTFPRSNLPAVIDEAAIKNIEKQANAYEDLLKNLESQLFEIKYGDAAKLYAQTEFLKKKNIDLLAELHKQLKEEIRIAEETIRTMR